MKEFLSLIKKWMTRLLAGIATVLLSIMTLLVLYQVFTRYILNSPAAFTEELVRYFLIWTSFIGAAYAFITREHMCLILVRDSLSPSGKRILMTLIDILIPDLFYFCYYHRWLQAGFKCTEGIFCTSWYPKEAWYAIVLPISGLFYHSSSRLLIFMKM